MRKSDTKTTKTTKRPMIKRNRPCVLVHRSVEDSVDEDTTCAFIDGIASAGREYCDYPYVYPSYLSRSFDFRRREPPESVLSILTRCVNGRKRRIRTHLVVLFLRRERDSGPTPIRRYPSGSGPPLAISERQYHCGTSSELGTTTVNFLLPDSRVRVRSICFFSSFANGGELLQMTTASTPLSFALSVLVTR